MSMPTTVMLEALREHLTEAVAWMERIEDRVGFIEETVDDDAAADLAALRTAERVLGDRLAELDRQRANVQTIIANIRDDDLGFFPRRLAEIDEQRRHVAAALAGVREEIAGGRSP